MFMQMTNVLTANRAVGRDERARHPSRGNGWRRPGQVHSRVGGRRAVCHAESTHPSIRYVNEEELEVAIQSREKPLVIDLCVCCRLRHSLHGEAAVSWRRFFGDSEGRRMMVDGLAATACRRRLRTHTGLVRWLTHR